MMIQVLGRISSSNVQKVLWCCDELGLSCEQEDVGHGRRNRDSDYLAMNPNGTVPTIVCDGFILWESNTIIGYLASRYGHGTLYPEDLETRALAHQWMDWCNTVAIPSRRGLHRSMIVPQPEAQDAKTIAAAKRTFTATMQMLDDRLAKSEYVAGESFTFGDMPVGIVTHQWFGFEIDHGDMPHLRRWYDALSQRAGYRRHVLGGTG